MGDGAEVSAVSERLRGVLAQRPEVLDAYLFGSTARGDAQAHSDLDVAVYVDVARLPDGPFGYRAALASDLMAALCTSRVDLVLLNDAPPLLYGALLRDGVRLLSRDLRETTTREGRALSRYCDFLPQQAKIESAHHARIARGAFGR